MGQIENPNPIKSEPNLHKDEISDKMTLKDIRDLLLSLSVKSAWSLGGILVGGITSIFVFGYALGYSTADFVAFDFSNFPRFISFQQSTSTARPDPQSSAAAPSSGRDRYNGTPRTSDGELGISNELRSLVEQGDFQSAASKFPNLRESHFSGVGYHAYPSAAFAFDQIGQSSEALNVLNLLEERLTQDAAAGRGYLAPGRPPRKFLSEDFGTFIPRVKDPQVKSRMEHIRAAL